ncbi:hypothetical protein [Scytonema sp. UIC 10036]|uniref:hypothetical protein n=1 Tax=Scytonema sp. UIC 10036 TaxID=2304196 RepID=UPI001A9AA306|nr:hypothetical protein [Scytonema sp. UIC 10036]
MKLILPTNIVEDLQPQLPSDVNFVSLDSDGNIDGDATDAEVYFSWFLVKPTILNTVLEAAPKLRWHHAPNAGVDRILTPTNLEQYLKRDITLTNGAGVHAIPIAEFAIA